MHNVSPTRSNSSKDTNIYPNAIQALLNQYLPIFLGSATSAMAQYQDLDKVIRGMAYRLVNTVHKQDITHEIAKMKVLSHIKDCNKKIANLQVQLAQLHSTLNTYERPKGFSNNDRCIPNLIPLSNGLYIPTKWIQ